MGNFFSGFPRRGGGRDMGNAGVSVTDASPSLLLKIHDLDFEWKIHGFSALLKREAIPASSAYFHCCGYNWTLQVTPMRKKSGVKIPYVALCLTLSRHSFKPNCILNAMFELSMYNHSNGNFCGCEANYSFHVKNTRSDKKCLIPLEELLKSSDFLVDDNCVFRVRMLKTDVSSPQNKPVYVPEKTISVQNLFLRKKEFIKGAYTWTMNNFPDLKRSVLSPAFEVGEHKWNIKIHPLGDQWSTNSLSLCLQIHDPKETSPESGIMIEQTLSILDLEHRQHYSRSGRFVLAGNLGWGWSNFIPLKVLRDPSKGYIVGSKCAVKADITIIGSSNG